MKMGIKTTMFLESPQRQICYKFLAQEALKKSSHPAIVVENSIWGKEALENINLTLSRKEFKIKKDLSSIEVKKILKKCLVL